MSVAGCAIEGLPTRVIGVSADEPAHVIAGEVNRLAAEVMAMAASTATLPSATVDDAFVGEGYGVPTRASLEAARLFATHEGVLLDPTYTAKAGASLVARLRLGEFRRNATVLFWHTGGLPLVFV